MGALDSSNNVQVNKWTSGGGWGGWNVQEATRTNTPSFIVGAYNGSNQIMWAWSEVNGSNFDIIGSVLSTAAAAAGDGYWPGTILRPRFRPLIAGPMFTALYG